jgi:hypothetical protein
MNYEDVKRLIFAIQAGAALIATSIVTTGATIAMSLVFASFDNKVLVTGVVFIICVVAISSIQKLSKTILDI